MPARSLAIGIHLPDRGHFRPGTRQARVVRPIRANGPPAMHGGIGVSALVRYESIIEVEPLTVRPALKLTTVDRLPLTRLSSSIRMILTRLYAMEEPLQLDKIVKHLDKSNRVRLKFGEANILSAKDELNAFRTKCGQVDDLMTSLEYYLPWTKIWRAWPILVMVYRQNCLFGVVLLHLRTKSGIPVGIARAGNGSGQGSVVGNPTDWCEIIEIVSKTILKLPAVHTVFISAHWSHQAIQLENRPAQNLQGQWQFRSTRNRLKLTAGYDATMAQLGYKMRRNLRYYRKRAQAELCCHFISDLNDQQRNEAVLSLYSKGIYVHDRCRALSVEAVLRSVAGHFAMGLQKANGDWVSYVAGWRIAGLTFVEWQLNDSQYDKLSISTVMRGFLLEHEAESNIDEINFVGGTSEIWSRVCEPSLCGELLATRKGLVGALTQRVTMLLRPHGELAQLYRTGFRNAADHI